MKDPENSRADSAAQSRESYKKDLEKNYWNEIGLAIGRVHVLLFMRHIW